MIGSFLVNGLKTILFGSSSDKGQSNIVKAASFIGDQYDKAGYTDQEKAEAIKEQMKNFTEYFKLTVNENSQRSLKRRELATLIMRLAVFMTVGSIGVYKFDQEFSSYIFLWFQTWWPLTAGVGVFFFGTHLARALTGKGKAE